MSTGNVASEAGSELNVRHEEQNLETAIRELEKARVKMKTHVIRSQHDLERREERANMLATTGGCPG